MLTGLATPYNSNRSFVTGGDNIPYKLEKQQKSMQSKVNALKDVLGTLGNV